MDVTLNIYLIYLATADKVVLKITWKNFPTSTFWRSTAQCIYLVVYRASWIQFIATHTDESWRKLKIPKSLNQISKNYTQISQTECFVIKVL